MPRLYRYRPLTSFTYDEVINREIWYSRFAHLNDPFEGLHTGLMAGGLDPFIQTLGVCCFSTAPDALLMWAHYSDSHRGICLEYEVDEETMQGQFMRVRYEDEVPTLDDIRASADGTLEIKIEDEARTFLTKSPDWSYEQEFRTFKVLDDDTSPGRRLRCRVTLLRFSSAYAALSQPSGHSTG